MAWKMATASVALLFAAVALAQSSSKVPTETVKVYGSCGTPTSTLFPPLFSYAPMPSKIPTVSDVPACAQPCVGDLGGCAMGDVSCICNNRPYITRVAACISERCPSPQCQPVIDFGTSVCAAVGVTMLPQPSCASTTIGTPVPTSTRIPTISEVPSCAQACVGDLGGCAMGDVNCICNNRPYITRVAACVSERCPSPQCQPVIDFGTSVCAAVGVTMLPQPSCASTTISTPVPTSTRIPTVSEVPTCAQACVGDLGGCAMGDVNCICNNSAYLTQVAACVSSSCPAASCQQCIDFGTSVCNNVGVYALPQPSCAVSTTTPTSAPTPSTYIPTVSQVPVCAQACVDDLGGCSIGDVTCICSNTAYLTRVAACISQRCPAAPCQQCIDFGTTVCNNVGIFNLPQPSCAASTVTTSLPAPPASTITTTVYLPGSTFATTIYQSGTTLVSTVSSPGTTIVQTITLTTDRVVPTTVIQTETQTPPPVSPPVSPPVYPDNTPTPTYSTTTFTPAITDLPPCAQTCISNIGTCAAGDVSCVCKDTALLNQYAACIQRTCPPIQGEQAAEYARLVCRAVGVTSFPTLSYPFSTSTSTSVPDIPQVTTTTTTTTPFVSSLSSIASSTSSVASSVSSVDSSLSSSISSLSSVVSSSSSVDSSLSSVSSSISSSISSELSSSASSLSSIVLPPVPTTTTTTTTSPSSSEVFSTTLSIPSTAVPVVPDVTTTTTTTSESSSVSSSLSSVSSSLSSVSSSLSSVSSVLSSASSSASSSVSSTSSSSSSASSSSISASLSPSSSSASSSLSSASSSSSSSLASSSSSSSSASSSSSSPSSVRSSTSSLVVGPPDTYPSNTPITSTTVTTTTTLPITSTTVTTTTTSSQSSSSSTPVSSSVTAVPGSCYTAISAAASPAACPADNGKTILDASGQPYYIGCDYSIPGANLGSAYSDANPSTSYDRCLTLCTTNTFTYDAGQTAPCYGFIWFNNYCYFKTFTTKQTLDTPQTGAIAVLRPEWLSTYPCATISSSSSASYSVTPIFSTTITSMTSSSSSSSSSSSASSVSSSISSSASSASSSLSSASSSLSSATSAPTCSTPPLVAGQCVNDDRTTCSLSTGQYYNVYCQSDIVVAGTDQALVPIAYNQPNYAACMALCSANNFTRESLAGDTTCHGFTMLGLTGGTCYFKNYQAPQTVRTVTGTQSQALVILPQYVAGYVAPVGQCPAAPQSPSPTALVTAAGPTTTAITTPPPVSTSSTSTSSRVSSTRTGPAVFSSSPPALGCQNVGWLTQDNGYWGVVDISAGTVVRNGTFTFTDGATRMQAIGYNVIDGLVYGIDNIGAVSRFGLDLRPQILTTGYPLYQTGDVDLSGQYWAARTSVNPTPWIHVDVDPRSGNYGNLVLAGTFTPPWPYFFADWAYVPGTDDDLLWAVGVNRTGTYSTTQFQGNGLTESNGAAALFNFRKSTGVLTRVYEFGVLNPPLTINNNLPNFGAVYASSEAGILYGSENLSGSIWRFNVLLNPPTVAQYATGGPTTEQNDGARCIEASVANPPPGYRGG